MKRKWFDRSLHMLQVQDCRGICLFCRHYDICREDCRAEKRKKEEGCNGRKKPGGRSRQKR